MKEIINYGEARRQQILKGFTNIEECIEEAPIEKARHGVYADNAQNRRLQRVGQEYGHAAQEKPEAGQEEGGAPEANVSLQNHARQASEEALVKAANDPSADAEMRKVATAELERRGVNVRAKNKKGDQSLRDGLADGDADFDAKGFKSFVKEKGGKAVKELAETMRNMPSEAAVSDPDDSEIADEIENMFEEAGMRVPREAKKELDNLRGSGESVVAKWDAYMSDETGDGDDFETAINNLIDNKGQVKAIKDIAAAMKAVDSADANQSDLDDDEIADEIENMFEEAGIDLSKKGQAALDKMREEANADADVDDAGKYVDSFNDMAENDTDFDAKGFKSFVKEKGDARAIKALARYMRENPVDTGGVESEPGDGDLADEIENMFEMAGVKISKKGRKELDAMIASEDDE